MGAPVDELNWTQIQKFISRLNELTKGEYRLPTQVELALTYKKYSDLNFALPDGGDISEWIADCQTCFAHSLVKNKATELISSTFYTGRSQFHVVRADSVIGREKANQAVVKFNERNWGEVINLTTEAIRFIPKDSSPYITRSGAYINTGRYFEAIEDGNTAIRQNPNEGMGFNNRGLANEFLKKVNEARADYETACNLKLELGCTNLKRLSQVAR